MLNLVFPGDLNTRTGGYRYDKRIAEELEKLDGDAGKEVSRISLQGDFPFPTPAQLSLADEQFAQLTEDSLVLVDGLAFSTMPEIAEKHAQRLRLLALVHHPLALETGLSADQARQLQASETAALCHAEQVITTSKLTANSLADYGVPPEKVKAILPGTDKAPLACGGQQTHEKNDESFNLLCVATLTPRKGHDTLFNALASIKSIPWHLYCVGSVDRHTETYQKLLEKRATLGLKDRISFTGEVEDTELNHHYNQADAFVLASYHEGYGMVLTEAIARGLPIICTSGGAMQDTVPEGSGLLVDPGDTEALAHALEKYMSDSQLRGELQRGAISAREQLRSWQDAARELSTLLHSIPQQSNTPVPTARS